MKNLVEGKRSEGSYDGAPAWTEQFLVGSVSALRWSFLCSQFPSLSPCWGEGQGRGATGPSKAMRVLLKARTNEQGEVDDAKGLIKEKLILLGEKRQGAGKEPLVEKCLFPQV